MFYRGQIGQWAWLLHRVSGAAVALFLFVHILDTALVGFGPTAYNTVTSVYHNTFVRILEVLLVGAVFYHGANGVRLLVIDFWPRGISYNRAMMVAGLVVFPIIMLVVAYVMLRTSF